MSDRQRRIEVELRRGHPDEESYAPPAWQTVRTRPVARVGSDGLRRPLSLVTAATISVALLVVAGMTIGLAGSLGPDRSTVATTPSASQAAVVSPSPSASLPRSAASDLLSQSLTIDCGGIDTSTCNRVVAYLESNDQLHLATVYLAAYEPVCVITRWCTPPIAGYDFDVRAMGTTTSGAPVALACSTHAVRITCSESPDEDRLPLATFALRFDGPSTEPAVLQLTSAPKPGQATIGSLSTEPIAAGSYRILVPQKSCDGCTAQLGPPGSPIPSGWCSTDFVAQNGAVIDARATTTQDGGPCRIEVIVSKAAATSCRVTVAASPIHAGDTAHVEASGLTPGGWGAGLADLHRDGRAVPLVFSAEGTFVREFTAGAWMVGTHDVWIVDALAGCTARTSLRIDP
jgi:hypothetical protein